VFVLDAYIDESGIEESYCAVAGFLGLTDNWGPFEDAWKDVLKEADAQYFHANKFFHGIKPYEGWSLSKREAFLGALIELITDNKRELQLVAAAVDIAAFRARSEDERIYLTGGRWTDGKWAFRGAPARPYYVPLCSVLNSCYRHRVRVNLFHDQQNVYAEHVRRLHSEMQQHLPILRRRHIGAITFGSKLDYVPLQAADLAAYLTFHRLSYGKQVLDTDIGKASKAFRHFGDSAIVFYDEKTINSHLESLPKPIREGQTARQLRAQRNREQGIARQRAQQRIPKKKPEH
jgi:hypothetical protein